MKTILNFIEWWFVLDGRFPIHVFITGGIAFATIFLIGLYKIFIGEDKLEELSNWTMVALMFGVVIGMFFPIVLIVGLVVLTIYSLGKLCEKWGKNYRALTVPPDPEKLDKSLKEMEDLVDTRSATDIQHERFERQRD